MDEKLVITRESMPGYMLMHITGRIDGYWSKLLDETLDAALREGEHNIALDLENVIYLSSLGIRIFIKYSKLFKNIGGSFGIAKVSGNVLSVLEMVGLDSIMKWSDPVVTVTEDELKAKTLEISGYGFMLQSLDGNGKDKVGVKCTLAGDPDRIYSKGSQTEGTCLTVKFGRNRYGIGMGAIGNSFEDCAGRFGEFIAAGDALAYAPSGKINTPDYMISSGSLIPEIKILYGILLEGEFSSFIRFSPVTSGKRIALSQITDALHEITGFESFALVMVAESAGLVGASLQRSPMELIGGDNLFTYPQVKDNVNFTIEPEFHNYMTLNVGVVSENPGAELGKFTRVSAEGKKLYQHIHSAVFSYYPLGKSVLVQKEVIDALFEDDKLRGVMHLINDQREAVGTGESEFFHGVCWVAPLVL